MAKGKNADASAMRDSVGHAEYDAVSRILTSQQEQFRHQVAELHALSQRQWHHVSGLVLPYGGTTAKNTASGARGGADNNAGDRVAQAGAAAGFVQRKQPHLGGAPPLVRQRVAEDAMVNWFVAHAGGSKQQAPGATNWWQDPGRVFGMYTPTQLVPALDPSNTSGRSSQFMESMGMEGALPSGAFAPPSFGHAPGQAAGRDPSPSGEGPSPAGTQPAPGAPRRDDHHCSNLQYTLKRQHTHTTHGALGQQQQVPGLGMADVSRKIQKPKAKKATPQSAAGILLALTSEVPSLDKEQAKQAEKAPTEKTGEDAPAPASACPDEK